MTATGDSLEETHRRLAEAAVLSESMRVLQKSGSNIVAELQRTADGFAEWQHLPPGDAADAESKSRYYYHAHPKDDSRGRLAAEEHGHFHTFAEDEGKLVHLAGVSMSALGTPIGLFTVNSWVTGEEPRGAVRRAALLRRFEIDHVRPSWPVNLWIGSLLRFYAPVLHDLFAAHDRRLAEWAAAHPGEDPLKDRRLEITAFRLIDLSADVLALDEPAQRASIGM